MEDIPYPPSSTRGIRQKNNLPTFWYQATKKNREPRQPKECTGIASPVVLGPACQPWTSRKNTADSTASHTRLAGSSPNQTPGMNAAKGRICSVAANTQHFHLCQVFAGWNSMKHPPAWPGLFPVTKNFLTATVLLYGEKSFGSQIFSPAVHKYPELCTNTLQKMQQGTQKF